MADPFGQGDAAAVREEAHVADEVEKQHSKEHQDSASSDSSSLHGEKRISVPEGGADKDKDEFSHLPPHEAEILKAQISTEPYKVSFAHLFRYASKWDRVLMALYALTSIGAGAAMPLMTVIFGQLTSTFKNWFLGGVSPDEFSSQISHFTLYFVYLAIGEFALTYFSTTCSIYVGEHITRKIREHYLEAILRQNVGYFDKLGAGEFTTRITNDTYLVQEGISEKVSLTFIAISTFISAYVIGFTQSWKLTLILSSVIVAIVLIFSTFSIFIVKWTKKTLESYAKGGTLAEEVIATIRNAQAFGTQNRLAAKYNEYLFVAEKWGIRKASGIGVTIGAMFFIVYASYALAFWQGARFLVEGQIGINAIVTVLFAVNIGAFALGNVAPNSQAFLTALAAASKIYETIHRVPPIDSKSEAGKRLEHVQGNLEFRNVRFIYPSRPEVVILPDFSLSIPAGKTTALVGASGSGKSTIVHLVERFYEILSGRIMMDGVDTKELNLKWFRQQVAMVAQEPTLFGLTIFENVAHGLIGTKHEHASYEEKRALVEEACVKANAHQFITALTDGYETHVGERGFLLSGGQKQRIAIARAVVGDPKILLLDEATSALDVRSEGVVQDALDKAAESRTTIVIAHRLSTIKSADNIVVMSKGVILEQGRHDELLAKKGAYYQLCEAQRIAGEEERERLPNEEPNEEEELEKIGPNLLRQISSADGHGLGKYTTSNSISAQRLHGYEEKKKEYKLWELIKLTTSFNKPEMKIMSVGLFFSFCTGAGYPVSAVLFSKCIAAVSLPLSMADEIESQANYWSLMYFVLSLCILVSYMVNGVAFAYCSERLIRRVRDVSFRTMLRQDITFFDQPAHTVGALTSTLSTDTTDLAGISGVTLNTVISVFTTIIIAIVLSLAYGWKLALVCTSTVPVLLGCGYYRFYILHHFETQAKVSYEKSASFACEATAAIRTVACLTREKEVWQGYHDSVRMQQKRGLKGAIKSSALYAASQSLVFLIIALGFWYGGTLIVSGEYNITQFFVCFIAITFGTQSAGTFFSFAPSFGKARQAANAIKNLLDRVPFIDAYSTAGKKTVASEGEVEFLDVHFRYPTRPQVPVLRGLNLKVMPGQYIALVGPSGCGKSTTISLVERFYAPQAGQILLDGVDISALNVSDYRSHISLVSQEPTLYEGSVRYNVLLGTERLDVTQEELEEACKSANIHNFITSLPEGYDTLCGQKGTMLSGGQKQRVAIARALIRNPKVLLLDEATSALDSESEKVVQVALDAAARGRTTIAVAHRLSTIQHADLIYVFEAGVIREQGTHNQLMQQRGRYYELVQMQGLS